VKPTSEKIKTSVVTPFIIPFEFENGLRLRSRELAESAVNELTAFTAEDLMTANFEPKNLRIVPLKNLRRRKQRTFIYAGRRFPRRSCIEMEWSIELTVPYFEIETFKGSEVSHDERRGLSIQVTCEAFSDAINLILIAAQIAKPGGLSTYDHDIWLGKQFLDSQTGVRGILNEVVTFASEKGWPKIESLPIRGVWTWLRSIGTSSVEFSKTPLGRSVNAFTHLLTDNHRQGGGLIELMWAMVGLESLYGRGTQDITYQLVEKSKSFLSAPAGFEKLVKKMYSFRSSFVHGSSPFPGAFLPKGSSEHESFDDEAYDAACLASAMLIATLQQMAKRSLRTLIFSFRADEPNGSQV
jgi:hypothetical protein